MNIYLAGKMDENGAWRDALLGTEYDYDAKRVYPSWELIRWNEEMSEAPYPEWPLEPNTAVLGLHNYVGPYRVTWLNEPSRTANTGYFHGSSWNGQHGQMDHGHRQAIAVECSTAIQRADLVFAVLNRPDCFATLVEIGMASALGKFVYVLVHDDAVWSYDDYWFIDELPNVHIGSIGDHQPTISKWVHDGMLDAVLQWTARPEPTKPLSIVRAEQWKDEYTAVTRESLHAFNQIAKWSSDPRVRSEAQRMIKKIAG